MLGLFKGIPIITEVIGLGRTYLQSKVDTKKAETEAKVEVLKSASKSEGEWQRLMSEGSQTSWKDEYWTVVLSLPAIMAFIPEMQPYVESGFKALNEAPDWYKYSLLTAIGASFGLRGVSKFIGKK